MKTVQQFERLGASQRHNASPRLSIAAVAGPIDRAIWFGPFCLRPAAHPLLEADIPVHIGVRALDLLIVLVERAGEVVTKKELFARVWGGLTVVESNLGVQVALVRKALRDGQSGARYLMSVPGRGYRFVGSLWTTETRKPIEPRASPVESGSGPATRLTRLIGRADAVGDIVGRLDRHRFVTIVGPGAIGKASVALAVAEQAAASYDDGVYVVDCAPLLGTSLVARKLASALGLEIALDDPTRELVAFLHGKRMLIVLDCCERVVGAAAVLVENLLEGAGDVGILATSREPLRAKGESVYRLPPLEVPLASGAMIDQLRRSPDAPLITAEVDVLRDESGAYARKLAEACVRTTCTRHIGGLHDFVMLNALADTSSARGAFGHAVAALRSALT
jgi:DNA-binding winged helix-turn-helix (wHTH) protein